MGDKWAPEKLENKIALMEENCYAFSYTEYGLMNAKSEDSGIVIGSKEHITYQDM